MFHLRYYQQEATDAVRREWASHQATAVIAATGTGKTEMYLSLAVEEAGRVLVLAHRDYLLDQPIRRLAAAGFVDVAVEKAESKSERWTQKAHIVFGSVQSLAMPHRLATFDPSQFSLLVIDEAHRAVARTYRRVIDYFCQKNPRLRVLLLTATPKRKDNVAMGNLCGGDVSVAYTYGPQRAIAEGWIVPLKFYRRVVKDLDFSHVEMRGADLDPDQLEAAMMQEGPLHKVCRGLCDDDFSTLVFCPGVKVATAYATLMNQRYRPGEAAAMWQETDAAERERIAKKLANRELRYVFNVDIATEGYDVPELDRVAWAAPTASLVKFTQGTGRVFRPHSSLRGKLPASREHAEQRRLLMDDSPKPFGHVLTFYPENCRHTLCEPNDILGGDGLPADVRTAAKQIQEATASQPGGSSPEEDVETAHAVVELRALLNSKLQAVTATATVEDTEYDALGGSRNRLAGEGSKADRQAARAVSSDWPAGRAASEAQLRYLGRLGVERPAELGLTSFRASLTIDLIRQANFAPSRALACGKKQALAVLSKFKQEAGQ